MPVTGRVEGPDGVNVPGDVAGVDEPAEADEPDEVVVGVEAGVDEPPLGFVPVMLVMLWHNCVSQGAWIM